MATKPAVAVVNCTRTFFNRKAAESADAGLARLREARNHGNETFQQWGRRADEPVSRHRGKKELTDDLLLAIPVTSWSRLPSAR